MSEKRKDNKGRILKKGESQRKNGTYDYRFVDSKGKTHSVYAKTLDVLRQKEKEIERDIADGIDFAAGDEKVCDLVDRYMAMKRTIKPNSARSYSTVVKRIHVDAFGQRKIRSIKKSDAKAWFVKLHDEGLKRNTITVYKSVLQPAFEMAVDDDAIRKNPFRFNLSELLPDDEAKRVALTPAQQKKYLKFLRDYGSGVYYDDIVILLETGLRVSELYGITLSDVDFSKRRLYVRRQLCRTGDQPYFVCPPKSSSGIRTIPLSNTAYEAFQRVIAARPKPAVEMIIDGCGGFMFLDSYEKPKVAMHLENYMRQMQKKYRKLYGDTLPTVTPHVLRHTFCTNMQQAGLDPKSLQYVMGHSDPEITMSLYTHSDYDFVEHAFHEALSM